MADNGTQNLDAEHDQDYDGPDVEWMKVTEFRGQIASAHINNKGELSFTISVPFEDKYQAMKATDVRGVAMVFAVYEPVQKEGGE